MTIDIAQLAKNIAAELKTYSQLGFCDIPRGYTRIYLDGDFPGIWYTLSGESSERVPVGKEAIKGIIAGIEKKVVSSNNEPTEKLDVTINADKVFILRMGWDTSGMRSLLKAIISLPPDLILSPVVIHPYLLGDKVKDLNKNTAKKCVCFDLWDANLVKVFTQEFQHLNGDELFDTLLARFPELKVKPKEEGQSTIRERAITSGSATDRHFELRHSIKSKAEELGWSIEDIKGSIKNEFGVSNSRELSIPQLEAFLSRMSNF